MVNIYLKFNFTFNSSTESQRQSKVLYGVLCCRNYKWLSYWFIIWVNQVYCVEWQWLERKLWISSEKQVSGVLKDRLWLMHSVCLFKAGVRTQTIWGIVFNKQLQIQFSSHDNLTQTWLKNCRVSYLSPFTPMFYGSPSLSALASSSPSHPVSLITPRSHPDSDLPTWIRPQSQLMCWVSYTLMEFVCVCMCVRVQGNDTWHGGGLRLSRVPSRNVYPLLWGKLCQKTQSTLEPSTQTGDHTASTLKQQQPIFKKGICTAETSTN